MTKYSHNSNITVLGDAIMVGQQCYTHTVVGDDVIMVNPTILRGDGQCVLYKRSSERTPYDVYSVLSEDR